MPGPPADRSNTGRGSSGHRWRKAIGEKRGGAIELLPRAALTSIFLTEIKRLPLAAVGGPRCLPPQRSTTATLMGGGRAYILLSRW
jgi:hypothetical protein